MTATPRKLLPAALALSLLSPPAAAEEVPGGEGEMALFALDQVLKSETTVASRRARTIRETPGVVTLVTREEMLEAGARDLIDVLRMVPGFQFGGDTEGIVGVGFRGNWANEGKVLLLVDGLEMNELMYGGLMLGNHYPVDHIQSVEIIRGPGSAMYGGFAELAVVSVKTRGAKDLAGFAASAQYGQLQGGLGRRTLSAGYGQTFGDLGVSAQAFVGQGQRSTATYRDPVDPAFDYGMAGNSALDPLQLNLAASWKGLSVRFLYDDFRTTQKDGYGPSLYDREQVRFRTTAADARWDILIGERMTLTPRLTWMHELPWQATTPDNGCSADPNLDPARCPAVTFYDKTAERITGRLTLSWDVAEGVGLLAGVEAYRDQAWQNDPGVPDQYLFYGKTSITLWNQAAFAEVGWDNPVVNVLAGARVEHHSKFGASLVPRVALTKLVAPFHAKLLYAGAFKAPVIENTSTAPGATVSPDVKPERTRVFEAELGWQISEVAYLAVNAFDATIDDAIVFSTAIDPVSGAPVDVYQNYARTGTRGLEADFRLKAGWVSASATWSFYTTAGKNQVDVYQVPGHDSLMLGSAAHKVTAAATFRIGSHLSVTPTAIFLSPRYGYTTYDVDGNALALGQKGPDLYLNLFATWKNLLAKGLELGAGVYDLLGRGESYPQPYSGGHPPLPGPGREFLLRLSFNQGV
jgi:outer membrane cobalamin receptor